jgi:hypothetical protein
LVTGDDNFSHISNNETNSAQYIQQLVCIAMRMPLQHLSFQMCTAVIGQE